VSEKTEDKIIDTRTFCPATQKQAVLTCLIASGQRGRVKMGKPISCNQTECQKKGTLKCLLHAPQISI
jgi:hypothetical protein